MKTIFFLASLLMLSSVAFADESKLDDQKSSEPIAKEAVEASVKSAEATEKPAETKVPEKQTGKLRYGGFGAITVSGTKIKDENEVLVGLRGGLVINDSYHIGLGVHRQVTKASVNGKDTRLCYKGILIGRYFNKDSFIRPKVSLLIGRGRVGKKDDDKKMKMDKDDSDKFFIVQPEAGVVFDLSKYFKVSVDASYRYAADVKWEDYENSDLRNFNVGVSLIVGDF